MVSRYVAPAGNWAEEAVFRAAIAHRQATKSSQDPRDSDAAVDSE
jgi:hypothetical protein